PPAPNELSMAELLAAGLHLGHSKSRWNPFTLPFIYGQRSGTYIINLEHTVAYLRRALNATREVARAGGIILFIATRPNMVYPVGEAATACGQYHVNGKWLPGTLTNSEVVLGRYAPPATRNHVFKPDLMVFFNMLENKPALAEARASNIPTIGVVDTDCNPHCVTYPIPANDDSVTGIKLLAALFSKAAQEGAYLRQKAYYQQQQEQ
ncbi:ribosomal protein S2, flavodoxin-like domain-containing protein, partial [Dimargaris cristalligena]